MGKSVNYDLYEVGLVLSKRFLTLNSLSLPNFVSYDQPQSEFDKRLVARLVKGNTIGMGTGMYVGWRREPTIYVNVKVCATPVLNPGYRRWSYPGWKTDRTAVGVVAHECGHHAEEELRKKGFKLDSVWKSIIKTKKVSGYEPIPAESWAETLRLFILNPDLLEKAIPARYSYISKWLQPSETRSWDEVLNQHPGYLAAAENWIKAKK